MRQPILTPRVLNKYNHWASDRDNNRYRPYITSQSSNTRGWAHVTKGISSSHIHHTLSREEFKFLLLLENNRLVKVIFEQYALNPVITLEICNDSEVLHPLQRNRRTGIREVFVMTTDMLVGFTDDTRKAYSCKPVNIFDEDHPKYNSRSFQRERIKYWVAEEHWRRLGVPQEFIDTSTINPTEIYNLWWFRERALIEPSLKDIEAFLDSFREVYLEDDEATLSEILNEIDERVSFDGYLATDLFRHLAWLRAIPLDFTQEVELHRKLRF